MKGFLEFLLFMQSYGASGQEFWNCIVFCFCDITVRQKMKSWFEITVRALLGPEEGDDKHVVILGRHVRWTADGIEY